MIMKKCDWIKKAAAISCAALMSLAPVSAIPASAVSSTPDFSYLGAVGTLTEKQTKKVAESIYEAIQEHSDIATFNISGRSGKIEMTTDNMQSIRMVYMTIISEYDFAILAGKISLSYGQVDGNYIGAIQFSYYVDDAEYDTVYQELQNQLDEISALVLDEWSDVEKALFLHDYLAYHYDFDHTEYETNAEERLCHSAYGMLTRGKAVCEGYACLYSMLMNREGIETHLMTSDTLGHAWNIVKIGDEWFHVDVTWDDAFDTHIGAVKHDSFLKDKSAMVESNHKYDDWQTLAHVQESDMNVSSRYNKGFWNNSNAIIQYRDGQWFAINSTENYAYTAEYSWYDYDAEANTAEQTLLTTDTRYWTILGGNQVYVGNFSVPAFYKDVIFYSVPDSILFLNGNQTYWLLDLTPEQKEQGHIYAIHIDGDTLYYDVADSPDTDAIEYSVDLTQYQNEYIGGMFTNASETTTTTTETTTTTTTSTTATTTTITTKPTTSTTTTTTTTTTKPTTSTTTTTTTTTKPTTSTTTTTTTTTTKPTTSTTTTTTTTTKPTTSTTTTTTTTTTKPTTSTTTTTTTTTMPTTSTTTTETTTTEPPVISGDFDGNGVLDISDLVIFKNYLHGTGTLTESQFLIADLNGDGNVNVIDYALMKREITK